MKNIQLLKDFQFTTSSFKWFTLAALLIVSQVAYANYDGSGLIIIFMWLFLMLLFGLIFLSFLVFLSGKKSKVYGISVSILTLIIISIPMAVQKEIFSDRDLRITFFAVLLLGIVSLFFAFMVAKQPKNKKN